MTKGQREYYKRFAQFAIDCAKLVNKLDWKIIANVEWGKQLIRSSGSTGGNYIEAIKGTSDADFIYRYRICCKESNESVHWLFLLKNINGEKYHQEMDRLMNEGLAFGRMFTTAIETKQRNIKKNENKE